MMTLRHFSNKSFIITSFIVSALFGFFKGYESGDAALGFLLYFILMSGMILYNLFNGIRKFKKEKDIAKYHFRYIGISLLSGVLFAVILITWFMIGSPGH